MNVKAATVNPALIADLLRESLAQGQQPQLTIVSNSMTPLLRIDDRIAIEACDPAQLQVGDIVVVSAENALYTHRFCQIVTHQSQQYLLTRGDRSWAYDPPWAAEKLVGRVVSIIRSEHMLSLTEGAGRTLHQRLTQVARWEEKMFANANMSLTWHDLADAQNRQLGHAWQKRWFRPIRTLIRLKIYSWRTVMVKLTSI